MPPGVLPQNLLEHNARQRQAKLARERADDAAVLEKMTPELQRPRDISAALGWDPTRVQKALNRLVASNKVRKLAYRSNGALDPRWAYATVG